MDLRVKERVLEILTNHGQSTREDIGMSSTLESLGIDSVGVVEVIFAIEEEFDINIPYNANETLSKRLDFSNVLSIVELVSELVRDNQKF